MTGKNPRGGRARLLRAVILVPGLLALRDVSAGGCMPALQAGDHPGAGRGSVAAADRIPTVAGGTLSGEPAQLPKDLEAGDRSAVLVVGFGRGASDATREWGRYLAETAADRPTTTYYVLPVMAGVPSLLRGSVLRAIARSVTPDGRRHFLPILRDEADWRRLAGVQDNSVPYLLLVNGTGEVRWRGSGAFSEERYKALQERVGALDRGLEDAP